MVRILVGEDELISHRMLAAALGQMGHEVVATADGREAWGVLQREEISLVIADWMIAEMDGLELVRRTGWHESSSPRRSAEASIPHPGNQPWISSTRRIRCQR
jgi:CheY-like chemotaxis protein